MPYVMDHPSSTENTNKKLNDENRQSVGHSMCFTQNDLTTFVRGGAATGGDAYSIAMGNAFYSRRMTKATWELNLISRDRTNTWYHYLDFYEGHLVN